jgi:glycerophosphoryl diester phosphodiesterase
VRDDSEGPSGPSSSSLRSSAGPQPSVPRIVTIAHRAGNDRAALEQALSAGVDAVEADLRWDSGRIVTRHDRRLPFSRLYWGYWHLRFDPRRQGTLDEFLEQVRGRAWPYLDLKAPARPFARALLEALRRHNIAKETEVSTGHWRLLAELRRAEPGLRVIRSVGNRRDLADLLALPGDDPLQAGVAISRDLLDEELAHRLRALRPTLYVWGIDDLEDARRVVGWGATGVIADSLELLRTLKSESAEAGG